MPILSICIPTYNRAAPLRRLLTDLIKVKLSKPCDVEIFISDNASTDDTCSLLGELADSYELRYVTQNANIGPTDNYRYLIENCCGEYAWIVGDDDLVYPERVLKFISKLNELPPYELFILDTIITSPVRTNLIDMRKHGTLDGQVVLNKILSKSLFPFGHYTSYAFQVRAARHILSPPDLYLGFWPHQFILLNIIASGIPNIYSLSSPLAAQGNSTEGDKLSLDLWLKIEADRLYTLILQPSRLNPLLQILLLFRQLYSFRLIKQFALIAWLTPLSVTPLLSFDFYLRPNNITLPGLVGFVLIIPIKIFLFSLFFWAKPLSFYSRLFFSYCQKYSIDPITSRPVNSPRFILGTTDNEKTCLPRKIG